MAKVETNKATGTTSLIIQMTVSVNNFKNLAQYAISPSSPVVAAKIASIRFTYPWRDGHAEL